MFEVHAEYDFDDYPEGDQKMFAAAGRVSDFSGTNFTKRDLGWMVKDFNEAVAMRLRLEEAGATATIREK